MLENALPMNSSRSFMVLCLIFKSFWVYFCAWHDGVFYFIDLHMVIQLSQHRLLKRLSFLHCIFLLSLSKINWCVDLLLGSLFCCIDPYVCFCAKIGRLDIVRKSLKLSSFLFFFLFAALIDTFHAFQICYPFFCFIVFSWTPSFIFLTNYYISQLHDLYLYFLIFFVSLLKFSLDSWISLLILVSIIMTSHNFELYQVNHLSDFIKMFFWDLILFFSLEHSTLFLHFPRISFFSLH